jgi:hypothetical protein
MEMIKMSATGGKTNSIKIFLLLAAFFAAPTFVFAAPTLSGYSGVASDGSSITLSGTSFGTNAAVGTSNLEFLGGKNGPIESGTVGTDFNGARSGWSVMQDWGNTLQFSTDSVLFGTKVLHNQLDLANLQEAPLTYSFPSPVTSSDHLFISWWQRTTWTGNGQYKILRLSPQYKVTDDVGQTTLFFHNNAGGLTFGPYEYPNDGTLYPGFSPATPQSTWARFDMDIETSGNTTGSVTLTKYIPGQALGNEQYSSYHTHYSGLNWNYIIWQNYFGTDGTGSMTTGATWMDDIFIQHGTPARVELCDSAIWANRKQCMIQNPTAWAVSSVNIELNAGNFASGSTKYLYLIDSVGAVSNSLAVTIGSGASDVIAPAAPSGLQVQ